MQNNISVIPCGTVVEYGFDVPRSKGVIIGILISGFGHVEYRVSCYAGGGVDVHMFEALDLKVAVSNTAEGKKANVSLQNVGHQYNI